MTDKLTPGQIQDPDVSSSELDDVIHANKDLFDKLNQLPEIEALQAIDEEDEKKAEEKAKPNPFLKALSKLPGIYTENELVRYAAWAMLLILISTSALTFIEYDMF